MRGIDSERGRGRGSGEGKTRAGAEDRGQRMTSGHFHSVTVGDIGDANDDFGKFCFINNGKGRIGMHWPAVFGDITTLTASLLVPDQQV
jgi:hypothetical protein